MKPWLVACVAGLLAFAPAAAHDIDSAVFSQLETLRIQPADAAPDAVFMRRVYLDVIGTLPTPDEARAFLADATPDKRRRLIDSLLDRPECADYWAMKWGETLRVKSEFPINLWPNAAQAYHHWIRRSIRDNVPYDRFAGELLTASGSNFRVPPVNFYRAVESREPNAIAAAVALTWMGTRIDTWPADRVSAMSAFFARTAYKPTREWKEEIVFFNILEPPASDRYTLPDGKTVRIPAGTDPREVFAQWLTTGRNPWFAKTIANRVWFWLVGRGIVHEPDDLRADNPPVNAELLALLEREIVEARFDPKHLYRLILNSKTYQRSAIPKTRSPAAEAHFAHAIVRPLEAEVLIDAICQVTGVGETYSSVIPEPFTFAPADQRAIALHDGSITSAFLQTFGRPSRDTGLASERGTKASAAARLHLLNSSHVQRKLEESPAIRALMQERRGGRGFATELYLRILSRPPAEEELAAADAYARAPGMNPRAAAIDLAWALMNSAEFLHRH